MKITVIGATSQIGSQVVDLLGRGGHDVVAASRASLCGLGIGYPHPSFGGNSLAVPRDPVEANVVFLDS